MSYRKYNYKNFSCTLPNGKTVMFVCWAQKTSYGFRHLCKNIDDNVEYTAKACYYNRTWESFEYETVLKKAIETLPKEIQVYVSVNIINRTRESVKRECENFTKAFKMEYEKLTPAMKELMAKQTIETEAQAKSTLAVMKMANIIKGK